MISVTSREAQFHLLRLNIEANTADWRCSLCSADDDILLINLTFAAFAELQKLFRRKAGHLHVERWLYKVTPSSTKFSIGENKGVEMSINS